MPTLPDKEEEYYEINDENTKFVNQIINDPRYFNLLTDYIPKEDEIDERVEQPIDNKAKSRRYVDKLNIPPQEISLKLKIKESNLTMFSADFRIEKQTKQMSKYPLTPNNFMNESMMEKIRNTPVQDPISGSEIIIQIQVINYFSQGSFHARIQEFLVLGSQKLSELRDLIYCANNYYFQKERPENPFYPLLERPIKSAKGSGSGFFFIEGVFYNDFREHNAIDYSKNIINFINQMPRDKQPYGGVLSTSEMDKVTFSDLCLRVNNEYVYMHAGDCQHALIIKDVRNITSQDCQERSLYPIRTLLSKLKRKKCRMCDVYSAAVGCLNDPNAPETPCLYCEECFDLFQFDENRNCLNPELVAVPYLHE
ncbi:hypothetical protein ROZALSC1DRAFT_27148 [Rozella allomycis CSF55]|uniref:snRNA-activating protein complex, subunit 3 domain-containing protein n=1 Tax=Rozella allomycis (strain CSF55) TaxID=988480 RepID=A0A075ATX2_ROZAC|nr:snRNA-activating protein complex, subunit 3 domain-containing protein [Rozella allomycis CSF55]RKP21448.1 hypothetical protein ROZALSC1DRAFT_27148 [Rozella allomycis CSF55]|eukprot:EPZ33713.1 snRNA-activating protein complex, subunit 3 domain-containing protein [Rozella allomycis CSF55]